MIDHCPRIAKREAENRRMEETDRRAAPLFYLVIILTIIAFAGGVI